MAICGSPSTTLNTPCGKPACSANCASASAENGVSCAGLTTTAHPAANAAAALRVIMAEGKFHGVIKAATPTGSFTVPSCVSGRRSEEHTSELQSLMRISYAVFCLKKKKEQMRTK